jgi:ribonuclease BN (tRNA processing enzyme)
VAGVSARLPYVHEELGAIATASQPKLLVLYHRANRGATRWAPAAAGREATEALAEMHEFYGGKVVEAHDLDVF